MSEGVFTTIRKYQTAAPVEVGAIARDLGIEILADDTLPDSISGSIARDDEGFFITVNARHALSRQRFTIAHELAHYVLHRDQIGDGIQDSALYRSHLSGRCEVEANKLAADILMPLDLVQTVLDQLGDKATVDELARRFHVSKSAMSIRLGVPLD